MCKDASKRIYSIHILWGTLSAVLTVAGVAEWITNWIALILGAALVISYAWHNKLRIRQALQWVEVKIQTHARLFLVAFAVLVLSLIGMIFQNDIADLVAKYQADQEARNLIEQAAFDQFRTRPVCQKNCDQLNWLVTDCASKTINAYNNNLIHNHRQIANSFRECLVDTELQWNSCKYGETNCTHFYYWRDRRDDILRDRYRLAFQR